MPKSQAPGKVLHRLYTSLGAGFLAVADCRLTDWSSERGRINEDNSGNSRQPFWERTAQFAGQLIVMMLHRCDAAASKQQELYLP